MHALGHQQGWAVETAPGQSFASAEIIKCFVSLKYVHPATPAEPLYPCCRLSESANIMSAEASSSANQQDDVGGHGDNYPAAGQPSPDLLHVPCW